MLELGNAIVNEIYEAKWPLVSHNSLLESPNTPAVSPISEANSGANDESIKFNSEFYVASNSESLTAPDSEGTLLLLEQSPRSTANNGPTSSTQVQRPSPLVKIDANSSRADRIRWIRAKYIEKWFVDKSVNLKILPAEDDRSPKSAEGSPTMPALSSPAVSRVSLVESSSFKAIHSKVVSMLSSPAYLDMIQQSESCNLIDIYYNLLLYEAAATCDLKVMALALAADASVNWVNKQDTGRSPLYKVKKLNL